MKYNCVQFFILFYIKNELKKQRFWFNSISNFGARSNCTSNHVAKKLHTHWNTCWQCMCASTTRWRPTATLHPYCHPQVPCWTGENCPCLNGRAATSRRKTWWLPLRAVSSGCWAKRLNISSGRPIFTITQSPNFAIRWMHENGAQRQFVKLL